MGADKRRSDRHHVRFRLVYDDGESYNAGIVRDLSVSGVFLETADPLPVGTDVTISSLEVEDDLAFEVAARVVRVEPPDEDRLDAPGLGFQFVHLDDEQKDFLLRFIDRVESSEAEVRGERDPFLGKSLPREGSRRSPSGVFALPRNGHETVEAGAATPSAPELGDEEQPTQP